MVGLARLERGIPWVRSPLIVDLIDIDLAVPAPPIWAWLDGKNLNRCCPYESSPRELSSCVAAMLARLGKARPLFRRDVSVSKLSEWATGYPHPHSEV